MFTRDEIAGIVELFGALTPEETNRALSELAYRHGEEPPEGVIDDALEAFALVEVETDGEQLLAPGPAAFPELPEGSEDLPHILEVDDRSVAREAIERATTERLRSETDRVVAADDGERAAELLEISYDIEAWGQPDLSAVRDRLADVSDSTN
jgi:CheY-like chemotaxis protein